jgi:hypothetical protein
MPHASVQVSKVGRLACSNLEKHEAREALWAAQAVRLGAALGKKPEEVTLTRAFEFRQRREKLDHIDKSKAVHERVPPDTYWQLTLRDAYARYIPIGNEFSGALRCPCRKGGLQSTGGRWPTLQLSMPSVTFNPASAQRICSLHPKQPRRVCCHSLTGYDTWLDPQWTIPAQGCSR